ncbi:MAG: hypothetical protein CL789_03875 [Chloroflexi bacterium]|nr:hypothetical protein [Chloroflexota bacterium]
MRRALTILAPIVAITSLIVLAVLLFQYRTRIRGHSLGLPAPNLDPRPSNMLGINVELIDESPETIDKSFDVISNTGFGWVRQTFYWDLGEFNWSATDRLINSAIANDLQIIAVLTSSNIPDQTNEFAQFAYTFADRYSEQVDTYQIGDEPNLISAWGRTPSAVEYSNLLATIYPLIHQADTNATILTAGLAPTTENSTENINDILYLRQLYAAGAEDYFDAVAGKPYGFNTGPDDRRTNNDILNFSRFILLREEMEKSGDNSKLLWASQFGWYDPLAATNPQTTWGTVSEEQQSNFTITAIERARNEWPWAGVLVLENYSPGINIKDPRWGFSLTNPKGTYRKIITDLKNYLSVDETSAARHGIHPAASPYAKYSNGWDFSNLGADIPQTGPSNITFTFEGTEFGLIVRRGDYRATLYIDIDSKPANLLPTTQKGESYQILTAPNLSTQVELIPIANNLEPGKHIARIRADRGWDQWAIVGFSVGNKPAYDSNLITLFALLLFCSSVGYMMFNHKIILTFLSNIILYFTNRVNMLFTLCLGTVFWISAGMTWGQNLPQLFMRQNEFVPLAVTTLSALAYYVSPWLLLSLLSLVALLILFYLRPAVALAMIALVIPFYLYPKPMFERMFSTTEVFTLLTTAAVLIRSTINISSLSPDTSSWQLRLSSLDKAVITFATLSLISILSANELGAAITEFRVIILEPVLFYVLVRIVPLTKNELVRISDYFVIGAFLVAVIGLIQYALGVNLIAAEDGVMRLRSIFGSPNNVGLYLGRALPIAIAMSLISKPHISKIKRITYITASICMAVAILLSFSRGALLLGIPAATAAIIIYYKGKRSILPLSVLLAIACIVFTIFSSHPRIASLTNQTNGPTFFRINLWNSTLDMIMDKPITGVGLDNFLYSYRSKYISPDAWQDPNISHAHNMILDFSARLGLPGLASIMWILYAFFKAANRNIRSTRDPTLRLLYIGLTASMINFIAHGLVDASYWFIDLAFAFMLTIAMIQRTKNVEVNAEST